MAAATVDDVKPGTGIRTGSQTWFTGTEACLTAGRGAFV